MVPHSWKTRVKMYKNEKIVRQKQRFARRTKENKKAIMKGSVILLVLLVAAVSSSNAFDTDPEACGKDVKTVECKNEPCAGKICAQNKDAVCKNWYCGGCHAKWYDDNGNGPINEFCSVFYLKDLEVK